VKPELVARAPFLFIKKNMMRAISVGLSLLIIILVLRMALPEVAEPLVEIIVKSLNIINDALDHTGQGSLQY
jgi:hypothetical protein